MFPNIISINISIAYIMPRLCNVEKQAALPPDRDQELKNGRFMILGAVSQEPCADRTPQYCFAPYLDLEAFGISS